MKNLIHLNVIVLHYSLLQAAKTEIQIIELKEDYIYQYVVIE